MPNITIQGHSFDVPHDPAIIAGAVLDDNMAHSLQQTRLENIRNNMAARIKKMLNGSDTLTDEQVAQAQGQVNEYAAQYKFGQRAAGQPRVVRDPVEKEMFRLAKEALAAAFLAKHGEKLKGEQLAEGTEKLLEAKRDEFAKQARRNLADREKAGNEVLAAIGL